MSGRLSRWNGWQRLWLVGTILAVATFGLVLPYLELSKTYPYEYQRAVERDYDNPNCAPYYTQPFGQLAEPSWGDGGTCWHIYTSREYEGGQRAYLAYDEWRANDNQDWWNNMFGWMAGMSAFVLILSVVVYGLGIVVAWVVQGFRAA